LALPSFLDRIQMLDEPRLALFDADGTLWENDIADDCTIWMLGTGRIRTGHRWAEYKRIYAEDAPAGCRYLLTFYEGMRAEDLTRHVNAYWNEFMKLDYIEEPVEVLRYLAARGFEIWVVTGSPTDFLFPLLDRLPVQKIVGMDFEVDANGVLTGRHSGISCAGEGKAEKVISLWGGPIQFVAGNARLDEAMMRLARDVAWAVHPHPDLEKVARKEGWEIKPSPRPPYGTTGWLTLEQELAERGLTLPAPDAPAAGAAEERLPSDGSLARPGGPLAHPRSRGLGAPVTTAQGPAREDGHGSPEHSRESSARDP
jgi:HAD superfamily phosphoserine phosphatase-like hydrolase